jgi:hypothetical protein
MDANTLLISLISGSAGAFFTVLGGAHFERERWLRDKRLEEWRELVMAVEAAISGAETIATLTSNARSLSDSESDALKIKRIQIGRLYPLMRTRIFIRSAVHRAQLIEGSLALQSSFEDEKPDPTKIREKAGKLQTALEEAIEQDGSLNLENY